MVKVLELRCQRVCVYMLRRMLCWRLEGNVFVKGRFFIVIRRFYQFIMRANDVPSCPCLTCSIKITQVGISEVVYSQGYSMDREVDNCDQNCHVLPNLTIDGDHSSRRRCQVAAVFSSIHSSIMDHRLILTMVATKRSCMPRRLMRISQKALWSLKSLVDSTSLAYFHCPRKPIERFVTKTNHEQPRPRSFAHLHPRGTRREVQSIYFCSNKLSG